MMTVDNKTSPRVGVIGGTDPQVMDMIIGREALKEHGIKQLIINPGSTSTKLAIFKDEECLVKEDIEHDDKELETFDTLVDQLPFRAGEVKSFVKAHGYKLSDFNGIMGRGGLVFGIKSGGYKVNDSLAKALASDELSSPHASNLGGLIARKLGDEVGIPAYIYDAVTGSSLPEEALTTGFPEIKKQSMCHVLNSRAMAIKYGNNVGKNYEDMTVIVAHMGGGVSLSVHKEGQIIDSIGDDDGPMSPERSGGLQLLPFLKLCFSGKYTMSEIKKKIRGNGGMVAYLGTKDAREIEKRYAAGNEKAKLIYNTMAYQISKAIGQLAPVVSGKVDVIILTGGMAHSQLLTSMIRERVSFLAPVEVMAGENEMEALALGGLRILRGKEIAKEL